MKIKGLLLSLLVGIASVLIPLPASANAPQPPAGPVFNQVQLKVLADNDFAVFMGNDQEITRLFYQNNVSWYAQVDAIQTLDVYPVSGETFIYILPMGGNGYVPPGQGNGGEENWSGVLNNIPLLDYPGGEVAVGRSVADPKDILHSGYLILNQHITGFTTSAGNIANGDFSVTLEDLQPASRNLIWGDAIRSSSPQIADPFNSCTVACSGNRFSPSIPNGAWDFPDGTAVLFRYPLSNANLPVSPGDRSVTVTWKDPGAGGAVNDYLIEYKETSQPDTTFKVFGTVPGTARTSTVTGLTNGTAYTLRVTARNSAGEASSLGRSVVPTGTPSRPTNQAYAAGDRSVSIDFAAPDNDGGMAITNYAYSIDDGQTWIARNPAAVTSPITIPNLTNGSSYNVRLRAINPFGAGPASLPITVKAGITQTRTLTYLSGTLAETSPLPAGGTLNVGETFTLPNGPTRTNFTFTGWKEGNTLYAPGSTYTVGAVNPNLTAQWVQNSLLGVNTNQGASKVLTWNIAANQSIDVTVAAGASNSVRIQIPDGALAAGTEVIFWRLLNDELAKARINNSKDYFVNLAITWAKGDDISTPKYVVDAAVPIVLTITNPDIVAGATAWQIVGDTVKVIGNATRNGELVIQFTEDPVITAANVPPAPQFSAPVSTVDGFTVNITNYDLQYTWDTPTITAGTLSVGSPTGSTLPLTVTGLQPGQSATITQKAFLNGVFQAGTLTGNAIAPAVAPQSAPTQMVALIPEVYTFSKRVLIAGVSERVTLTGRRLNQIGKAAVNGQKASIASQAAGELVLDIPALPEGEFDLNMNLDSGASFTFLAAFKAMKPEETAIQIPTPISEIARKIRTSRNRVWNFAGDSAQLNKKVVLQLRRIPSNSSEVTQITCTGTTSARKSSAGDELLAKARANAVCEVLAPRYPNATVTVKAWPASGLGAKHRAVVVDLTRADN